MLRVGGVVPPPSEPVALRDRRSTGIGHASRFVDTPAARHNPHLPTHIKPPRAGFPLLVTAEGTEVASAEYRGLADWARAARPIIDRELRPHGAVVTRAAKS
jgi:hypothetical protein